MLDDESDCKFEVGTKVLVFIEGAGIHEGYFREYNPYPTPYPYGVYVPEVGDTYWVKEEEMAEVFEPNDLMKALLDKA